MSTPEQALQERKQVSEMDYCAGCGYCQCRCDEPWSLAWAGVVQEDEDGD